jgi:hypothetical protein
MAKQHAQHAKAAAKAERAAAGPKGRKRKAAEDAALAAKRGSGPATYGVNPAAAAAAAAAVFDATLHSMMSPMGASGAAPSPFGLGTNSWYGPGAGTSMFNTGGVEGTNNLGAHNLAPPRSPFGGVGIDGLFDGVGDASNPPMGAMGGSPAKNMNGSSSPLGALSTMMAGGASPLLANFPGMSGGSPGNLYASLLSSPGSMGRKNTVLRSTPGASGQLGAQGTMAPPSKASKGVDSSKAADIPQIAEDSPSISGLGWFDTPGGKQRGGGAGSKITPPANAPVPRMAGISAELAGLQSPPHLKGGAAAIPGRLSSIFRRAASGVDIASQGAVKTKEPAASRPADDVLEVMRQLEQQNAGDYAQAEQFLAAQERKTRAGAAAAAAAAAAMGVRVEGGDGMSPSQFLEMR